MDLSPLYLHDPAPAIQALLCTPSLDAAMEVVTVACEGWALVLLAAAITWWDARDWRVAARRALRCGAILLAVGLLVTVAKQLVVAPRPLQLLGEARVRVLLEPLRQHSFPSGHAAAAAALAVWAAFDSRGARRWPVLLAFLGGLSRVYVGAHWVLDVCAGWLLGGGVAVVCCLRWPGRREVPAAPGSGAVPVAGPAREV